MKELFYRFQNPYNSCEAVLKCRETKQHYILMPHTPYSYVLCTCTPYRGYYEADCPVKAGLNFIIDGHQVTTEAGGEIVDHAKKEAYENKEFTFYQMKPEHADNPNYENFSSERLFLKLFDYMKPEHFDQITLRRKDVYCLMGGWYRKEN